MEERKEKVIKTEMGQMDVVENEKCPYCDTNNLVLTETVREIPHFGKVYIYSMSCSNCKYHKSDIECEGNSGLKKVEFEVNSEKDLNVFVIKSASATVKIPRIGEISPGTASQGYITTIEGVINRIKRQLESLKDSEDEKSEIKKIKNKIKKINNILIGRESVKIVLIDPTGNSSIISDK